MNNKKALIFDSGTLINLSMNGLLYILKEIKMNFKGHFLITRQVKNEVIDRPLNVNRFKLGAMRIQRLIDNGILEFPLSVGINDTEINKKTKDLLSKANHIIKAKDQWINIVSDAEMSCLALSSLLKNKEIDSLIAIDERTTRTLAEKPQNLERIFSKKLHQKVNLQGNLSIFKSYKFIRSTELVYVAHKKGFLKVKGKKALEAVLYATKFKGASVSYDEIDILKHL